MTDDEVAAFLDEHRTVHVATLGAGGAPHLTTLWYGLVDGEVTFWTYASSQKVANLERDPRVAALVEAGDAYSELRGVQLRGRARVSSDHDEVMRTAEAVYVRNADRFGDVEYQGTSVSEGTREVLERMSAKRVAVTVEPEQVVSWDHGKLGSVY